MSDATNPPDPRTHAYRPDLADIALANTIKAERYKEPVLRQCIRGVVPMLAAPTLDAKQVSQIRYGEFLDVFEIREDGFAWVQNRLDRYVGYIPSQENLSEEIADLSNRVHVLKTFVYPEPDFKAPPVDMLTLGSCVSPIAQNGAFKELAGGGFVFAKHIAPTQEVLAPDYVFTAGRLLNVPYLWGGRTPEGIDCSGLVQLALELAGIDVPRDADQQCEVIGLPLESHWRDVSWKRGDIVFMPSHVGIMTGPDQIIHASGHPHHMFVTVEPLADAVMARGGEVTAVGRP